MTCAFCPEPADLRIALVAQPLTAAGRDLSVILKYRAGFVCCRCALRLDREKDPFLTSSEQN